MKERKKWIILTAVLTASMLFGPPVQGILSGAAHPVSLALAADKKPIREKKPPEDALSASDILDTACVIAHGMGALEEVDTGGVPLNCLEGFLSKYEEGVRVFEADLRLTRDGKVVLRHDWWPSSWQDGINWANIPTRETFLSTKILKKYTPLSFRDLLLLMEKYPDICVITDTKYMESDVFFLQFDAMLADAEELGLTYLFDRIAVQIYSSNMRYALNNIYRFPHYIYTLYQEGFDQTEEAFREKAVHCAQNQIEAITMPEEWWNPAYAAIAQENHIKIFIHTVNDQETAQKLLDSGVNAVYSDQLVPGDLTA